MRRPLVIAVAGLFLFAGAFALASCGGGDGESTARTLPESVTETTTTVETTTPETTTPTPVGPTVIRVAVVDASPRGGIVRETVQKGDRVVLVVTSDVTDHIHLHGYDLMRDVAPGRPARLAFTATIPGRFEVELEDHGVQIADITVNP